MTSAPGRKRDLGGAPVEAPQTALSPESFADPSLEWARSAPAGVTSARSVREPVALETSEAKDDLPPEQQQHGRAAARGCKRTVGSLLGSINLPVQSARRLSCK